MHKSSGSRIPLQDMISGHTLHRAGHRRRASFRMMATSLLHTCPSKNNSSAHFGLSGTPSHSPARVVVIVVMVVVVDVKVVVVVVAVVVVVDMVVVVVEMQELQRTGQFDIKNRAISGVLRNGLQKSAATLQCSVGSSFPSQFWVEVVVVEVIVVVVVVAVVVVVDVTVVVVMVLVLLMQTLQRTGQLVCAIIAVLELMDASQVSMVTSLHSFSSSRTPLQN